MSCPSFSIRVQTGQLMIVLFRGEQHKDQVQDDPHVKLALEMIEKVAVILEDRDDSSSFMVSEAFRELILNPDENMLCCVAPICQTLSQIQFPPDLEQTKIQTLLSTVADILTVRDSFRHLNIVN